MTNATNYDQRVINEFLKKAWRWDEHSDINKAALNYLGGFMLSGFTGNVSVDLNEGQYSRLIHTPAAIKNREDLNAAMLNMIEAVNEKRN